MKQRWILLALFTVGLVGLLSCGQIPNEPASLAGPAGPRLGDSTSAQIPQAPEFPLPEGAVLLQDSFEDAGIQSSTWAASDLSLEPGEMPQWQTANGVMAQEGTNLQAQSPNSAFTFSQAGADWTDYTVRAQFYVTTNEEVGLAFRAGSEGFYRFRIRPSTFDGPYQVGLDRYQDGKYTVLWHQEKGGFIEQQWFTVEITAKGTTITVLVDGRPVTTVEDSSLTHGGVGLYTRAEGGAYIDNLVVTR